MKNHYDVIIIGAGLGGLTAGLILSKAGKKVLLLEQHNKVGGYATNFKRKGFTFDVSLHNFGPIEEDKNLYNIFRKLGILGSLNYQGFDEFQRIVFPDFDFVIKKGITSFASKLYELFPEEKKGINNYLNTVKEIYNELDEINNSHIPVDRLQEKYPMLPLRFPNLVKLVDTTLNELLAQNIKNKKLWSIITNLWWICGLPPSELASILYTFPLMKYYEFSGGIIRGTSQHLSNLLAEKIQENNGNILLKEEAVEITFEDNRVSGIKTLSGKTFKSPLIVSNASAYDTIRKMIDEKNIKRKFRRRISGAEISISAMQLYLGLDCNPEKLGMKNHSISLYETYDHEKCYQDILSGNHEKTFLCMTNYSDFNDGGNVLIGMTLDHIKNWENLSRDEYKKRKDKMKTLLIRKIEKIIPDLSPHILVAELATPLTMKRYTKNTDGAIYGFSHSTGQSGVNRPANKTPVEGLYLAGAYTYPGAGYSSVILSGYEAANQILNEQK